MSKIERDLLEKTSEILVKMKEANTTGNMDLLLNEISILDNNEFVLLQNGNKGNILALALEQNYYIVASFLLNNYESLGLDLDHCAENEDDVFNIEDEFNYSLSYYEGEKELESFPLIAMGSDAHDFWHTLKSIHRELKLFRDSRYAYYKREALISNIYAKNQMQKFIEEKTKSNISK